MIETPLGPVAFAEDAIAVFPCARCCNCGATAGLSVIDQDTKSTSYMLFGGTEISFQFALPVCKPCEKSLSRRPPTPFHKFLMLFVVAFALFLMAVTLGTEFLPRFSLISNNLFASCVVAAFFLLLAFYSLRRPTGKQTSYYQPVRLARLKRTFLSGEIQGIGFKFTNPAYLKDFAAANKAAIKAGSIQALPA